MRVVVKGKTTGQSRVRHQKWPGTHGMFSDSPRPPLPWGEALEKPAKPKKSQPFGWLCEIRPSGLHKPLVLSGRVPVYLDNLLQDFNMGKALVVD